MSLWFIDFTQRQNPGDNWRQHKSTDFIMQMSLLLPNGRMEINLPSPDNILQLCNIIIAGHHKSEQLLIDQFWLSILAHIKRKLIKAFINIIWAKLYKYQTHLLPYWVLINMLSAAQCLLVLWPIETVWTTQWYIDRAFYLQCQH